MDVCLDAGLEANWVFERLRVCEHTHTNGRLDRGSCSYMREFKGEVQKMRA